MYLKRSTYWLYKLRRFLAPELASRIHQLCRSALEFPPCSPAFWFYLPFHFRPLAFNLVNFFLMDSMTFFKPVCLVLEYCFPVFWWHLCDIFCWLYLFIWILAFYVIPCKLLSHSPYPHYGLILICLLYYYPSPPHILKTTDYFIFVRSSYRRVN